MRPATLERRETAPVTVKVVILGSGITNYYVTDGAGTLGRLLDDLEVHEHMDVRVNGAKVDGAYRLSHGDQVVILPRIRSGSR